MSWHPWLLLIAASLYSCIAILGVLYWSMRREALRVLSFSALCVGLAMVSGATLVANTGWIEGAVLRQVTMTVHLGLGVALAGYVSFLGALVPLPRIVMRCALAIPVWIGLMLPLGLLESTVNTPRWTLWDVGPQLLPLAWWGIFHTVIGVGSVLTANLLLVRALDQARGRETVPVTPVIGSPNLSRSETLGILAAGALTIALAVHDAMCVLGFLRAPLTIATLSLLPVSATAFSFVFRVVQTSLALKSRLAELQEAQNALRTVRRRLSNQEQLAMVGDLSAVIAHQVRNPLGVIKNVVAGLGRTNLADTDRATLFEILDEEIEKLTQLTENLMAYARPVDPSPRSLDARTFLSNLLAQTDWSNEVIVRWRIAPDTKVWADPTLLRQAIEHILHNAKLAMAGGGSLTIRCVSESNTSGPTPAMRISFKDNGAGMTPEEVDKAASPFFTTRANGSGLGLAIVSRVLRSHGGRLEIESSIRGTRISCWLPLGQDRNAENEQRKS